MKSFLIDRYTKGGALRLSESPEPELRDNDVMVEIHAAGVNPLDSKIRDGEFKLILPYRLPLVLGNDVAGVVMQTGTNVRRFKRGESNPCVVQCLSKNVRRCAFREDSRACRRTRIAWDGAGCYYKCY
jgi:NADPH:quinone reductase-like Zn-dependent oxidoreductase